jgi:predicted nucleotidyltransferase
MGTLPTASLFGQTRGAVLSVLLLRPDERFHLRQIVRLIGGGVGAVQRELAALVAAGLVRREPSGRQVYFQAATDSPIFAEAQGLILKTSGLADVLRAALREVEPRLIVAAVFGSMAHGTVNRESDIDLLIISNDLSMRELGQAIRQASARLGREVNVNLYRPDEWGARARDGHPLVKSILANPRLIVTGGANELERLAEERVAQAARSGSRRDPAAVRRRRARPGRRKQRAH